MFSFNINRYILRLTLVLLLVGLSVTAARLGWSSVLSVSVERKFSYWADHAQTVELDEFELYWQRAQSATRLQPMNAHQWYLQGKTAEWGAYLYPDKSKEWHQISQNAYSKSSELRPSWPDTWLALAQLKAKKGEYDSEFLKYFDNVSKYGPYKKDVLYGQIQLGLSLWGYPEAGVMVQTLDVIQRGIKAPTTREQTYRIANQSGHTKVVCTLWRLKPRDETWKRCQ